MSIYTTHIPYPEVINHKYFSFVIQKKVSRVEIHMQSLTSLLNTQEVPLTYELAKKYIPTIFSTDCFNYDNLPFSEEIKRTEVAHLFEHILLSVLYALQSERGNNDVVYNGVTSWNWKKEKKGFFHITISIGAKDSAIFPIALHKSIAILELIYQSHEQHIKRRQIID